MAVVNKCCCCCQLRTGVMVLGWFGMVMALFNIAATGVVYANRDHFFQDSPDFRVSRVLDTALPVMITSGVVGLLSYILMAWGASSGNRYLLLPWLVLDMISIVSVGLGVLIGAIICMAIEWDGRFIVGGLILGIGIPIWALELYIWLCVLSCFQELRDCPTHEENALLELPKPLENIVIDYRPPEYEKLDNNPNM